MAGLARGGHRSSLAWAALVLAMFYLWASHGVAYFLAITMEWTGLPWAGASCPWVGLGWYGLGSFGCPRMSWAGHELSWVGHELNIS
jgi:hypothetical protein